MLCTAAGVHRYIATSLHHTDRGRANVTVTVSASIVLPYTTSLFTDRRHAQHVRRAMHVLLLALQLLVHQVSYATRSASQPYHSCMLTWRISRAAAACILILAVSCGTAVSLELL
jgi:hypothetical protein